MGDNFYYAAVFIVIAICAVVPVTIAIKGYYQSLDRQRDYDILLLQENIERRKAGMPLLESADTEEENE